MHSDLHLHLARAAALDRRGDPPHRPVPARPVAAAPSPPVTLNTTLALRLAHPDEAAIVRRLAALDEQPPLTGDLLLALADGEPVAALSLDDGRVAADPFRPSSEAAELLRLRARSLERAGTPRRRPRLARRASRARTAA